MPTILTHPAIPLATSLALGRSCISTRLVLLGVCASALPDADVIGLRLGIPYEHALGHRGFSHSLLFAALVALLASLLANRLKSPRHTVFVFIFMACASHPLLDMLTNGGHGVGLFWPFSEQRYFFPFRPIQVSPLSWARIWGPEGVAVLLSELRWVWLPAMLAGVWGWMWRRRRAQ